MNTSILNTLKEIIGIIIAIIFAQLKRIKKLISRLPPITNLKPSSHILLWTTFVFVAVFLIWSKFAILDESTSATATVIPISHVQTIQNMEGGIIQKITVKEGEIVQKGQILLYLDPTRFISALKETQSRIISLQIKIDRLSAEVDKKPFHIDSKQRADQPSLAKSEEEQYRLRQSQIQQMEKSAALIQRELNMTKPLVKEGAASIVEVLHLERQLFEIKNQINDFYARAYSDLQTAKADLAALNASLLALQDRFERTTVRSPVKGIVKQIKTPTNGGVVLPGAEILSVVPIDDQLMVEAQVKPADIGFIHPGENASVRITAYDYSIYGGLTGKVTGISADTITNEKGESYYLVRIVTHKNYLGTHENPLYIIPGMTASVNILTGKKSVLDYLLSPLLKARENALQER